LILLAIRFLVLLREPSAANQEIFARNTSGRGTCADLSLKEQLLLYEKTYYSYSSDGRCRCAPDFVHHSCGKTSSHHNDNDNALRIGQEGTGALDQCRTDNKSFVGELLTSLQATIRSGRDTLCVSLSFLGLRCRNRVWLDFRAFLAHDRRNRL
jgi:hypothetical protein